MSKTERPLALWLKVLIAGFILFLALVYAGVVHSTERKGPVSEDSYMKENEPTTNFGEPGSGGGARWGYDFPGAYYNTYFKDTIITGGGIPAGSTIDSVKLKIYLPALSGTQAREDTLWICNKNAVEAQMTWNVYRTDSSWDAGGGDFVSPVDSLMGTFSACGFCDRYETTTFTPKGVAVFQAWLDGDRPNYGIIGTGRGSEFQHDWMQSEGTNKDSFMIYYTEAVAETGAKAKVKQK